MGSAALLLYLMAASARVELSPDLAEWKREIEAAASRPILLARVYTDPEGKELLLPPDAPERPAIAALLHQESFVRQLVDAHALSVTVESPRPLSIVLLNMAREREWRQQEEALLAHELGHLWLEARGFGAPRMLGGFACEAIHAGDMVQHVLIRRELRARGIAYIPLWVRTLEPALAELKRSPAPPAGCRAIGRLALWVDVLAGLTEDQWPARAEFLEKLAATSPELAPQAAGIARRVTAADLDDIAVYRAVLRDVLETVLALARAAAPGVPSGVSAGGHRLPPGVPATQ